MAELSICRFLESLTLEKLKQLLERERLPKSGLKSDIIKRITQNITPQRILLHTHDDDVIAFAEKCSFAEDGTYDSDRRRSRASIISKRHRRSSQTGDSSSSYTKRSYEVETSGDLEEYRALGNRCREWIIEHLWRDVSTPSMLEDMEDITDNNRPTVSVFKVEELPDDLQIHSVSLLRPLVTFPSDEEGLSYSSTNTELEEIKQIILTTLFSRLKSIRRLLLLDPVSDDRPHTVLSDSTNTSNESLTQLAIRACGCDTRTMAEVLGDQPNGRQFTLVSEIGELKWLFWGSSQSSISIRQLGQTSNDTGQMDVCTRLVEMSRVLDFEPNFERAEIRENDKGALEVGCQGFYYHDGEPIGPFQLYLVLIRNSTPSADLPIAYSSEVPNAIPVVDPPTSFWCIRVVIWECL